MCFLTGGEGGARCQRRADLKAVINDDDNNNNDGDNGGRDDGNDDDDDFNGWCWRE